jgi:leucyl/phenylalanyl-tRNA--protein transferase
MQEAYIQLHTLGHAVSVEVWEEGELAGGLYGIDLPDKKIFCGESMFIKATDASKVAFYYLVKELKSRRFNLIDCQVYNRHLESLGAEEIPREIFLRYLSLQK